MKIQVILHPVQLTVCCIVRITKQQKVKKSYDFIDKCTSTERSEMSFIFFGGHEKVGNGLRCEPTVQAYHTGVCVSSSRLAGSRHGHRPWRTL